LIGIEPSSYISACLSNGRAIPFTSLISSGFVILTFDESFKGEQVTVKLQFNKIQARLNSESLEDYIKRMVTIFNSNKEATDFPALSTQSNVSLSLDEVRIYQTDPLFSRDEENNNNLFQFSHSAILGDLASRYNQTERINVPITKKVVLIYTNTFSNHPPLRIVDVTNVETDQGIINNQISILIMTLKGFSNGFIRNYNGQ